jgi:hypothetical protein
MSRAFTTLVAESEKRNRAKTIIAASVGLDPLDQSAVISQLHQTGVGNKSILDAQLKAAKHDHLREHWSEMAHLEDNGLPIIETTHRHLRDITADAMDALRNHNGSPKIFVRGGVLTRIKPYEAQTIVSEVLTKDALRGELARAADFVGGKDFMGNPIPQPVSPPTNVVNDVMALPHWVHSPPR